MGPTRPRPSSATCNGLPAERLWTTVYHTDDEAFDLWTKMIGVPPERCIRIGDKPGGQPYQSDNFWQILGFIGGGVYSSFFEWVLHKYVMHRNNFV